MREFVSEQTIIDRRVMWESKVTFQVTGIPANGEYLVDYALKDGFAPFPLHQLCTVMTATINNNSVSINIKDTLPQMLRMLDPYELQAYNSTTPVMYDTYKYYSDAVGANNNPLGGWNNVAIDNQLVPRGAFYIDDISGNTVGDGSANKVVTISATFTEPLLLSPFLFADPKTNAQGIYGKIIAVV
jgi:hypothetical protein